MDESTLGLAGNQRTADVAACLDVIELDLNRLDLNR
jgi:hypothetical protein